MLLRREHVQEIGGFRAIAHFLADDYQLGNRIARNGHQIAICPIVVECWDSPMTWRQVWKHQLRWARTIRVCRPMPYFLSILSNAGWWALLWLGIGLAVPLRETRVHFNDGGFDASTTVSNTIFVALFCLVTRILVAFDLQRRLTRSTDHWIFSWLVPVKDVLQTGIWFCAFIGNTIEWRGQKFTLNPDGTLKKR